VADVHGERIRRDLVAHASALTSTRQRQLHPDPIPSFVADKV
jgi:hypothetical protein